MHELKSKLDHFQDEINRGLEKLDLPGLHKKVEDFETEMQKPGFWDDQDHARQVSQDADHLKKQIDAWESAAEECQELLDLLPTIKPEEDPEAAQEYRELVATFEKRWFALSIQTFLKGKYDKNNAMLSIHAGTGGKDAQDFAEMLLRMFMRYAERQEWQVEIIDRSNGEEVGIKSVTIMVKGFLAYGYLKGENGVHRLIRLSPFNSKHTRETSFAMVEVIPETPSVEVGEIPKDDLKIDTYRASGAGGQHVNTTDSAVRITHIPTGLVAQCQNERSQLQNREQAMQILHGKLVALKEKEKVESINELRNDNKEMSWGRQIRTYTLHPYTLVKDHRTNYEETNVDHVLDGDLEGFVTAEIESLEGK